MAWNAGGTIVFSYTDGTERWELRVPCAEFDPTTFAYTGTGLKIPTEAGIAATVANFGGVWAPYFDPTWTLTLEALFHQSSGTGTRLGTLPSVADVTGTSSTPSSANPPLMRGFTFTLDKGGRQVVRFFSVATTTTGARREVTATSGGFDSRDQALMAYLAGPSTGLVAWDGQIFPPTATAYQRFKLAPFERGGGGGGSSPPADCITFPRGATVCNDAADVVHVRTPGATHALDLTGYQLPAGHRVDSIAGLGDPVATAVRSLHLDSQTRVLSLWTPFGNTAPPGGWDLPPPADWPTAMLGDASIPFVPPAETVWTSHVANSPQQIIARGEFTLAAGTVVSAHLQCAVNDEFLAIHINGVAVSFSGLESALAAGMDIDTAPFTADGANVLAFWVSSNAVTGDASNSAITWSLAVSVVPPEEKLRLSHSTRGDQMLFPLVTLSASPGTLVGQDPATGLPAFCPAPVPTTTTLVLGGGGGSLAAPPSTCVQMRCGVSAVLRDHLLSLYTNWSKWLDPLFQACATLGVAVAVVSVPWDWLLDLAGMEAGLAIKGAVVSLLQGFGSAITGNLLPALDPDLVTHIQQAAFDALACTGDQVQVSAANITAWQAGLNALTTWPLASLAGPFCDLLLQFTPLAAWQGAAATATASHVCDAWP